MNLRLSGALCFIATAVAGAANAQERGLEFVPIVGLYNPLTDLRDPIDLGPLDFGIRQQPAFAFGARATLWLRGPFGLEGSFLWALSDAERVVLLQRSTADAYVWNASARIMIRLSGARDPIEFSVNGGLAWTNLEVTSSNANSWNQRDFDLGSLVPLTDQMRIRFRAEPITSLQNYRVLEAGMDDFELVSGCSSRFNAANGDSDADGIANGCDICPLDSADDIDGDGVCGQADNAPFTDNAGQVDTDGDGVGDVIDNCLTDLNPAQRDLDADGLGDLCDDDLDGDGTLNGSDDDRDNDGILDVSDVCPSVPDALQSDNDSDGEGDACDADDGVVQGVRIDGDRITWEPEVGSDDYNVYRGDVGAEALVNLAACRVAGLLNTFYVDPDLPVPGDGFFYLISRSSLGVEDSLGFKSDLTERLVNSPCP